MSIKKLTIDQFIHLVKQHPVLDVRSPGEYIHAQIPGAYSFPLFTDDERKIVGTAYKKQGRQAAIKLGLDFFGIKMRSMVEEAESISRNAQYSTPGDKHVVLVHCWRGGMRSAGIAWLLDLYGFEVYTLAGGYKAYRNWVLRQFEKEYDIRILGGFTGSGKTDLLEELQKSGNAVINLEAIAQHKGSAFGGIGQPTQQPTQEMFENKLAMALFETGGLSFWLEDESQRIGRLNIPNAFWKTMRSKPVYFIDIPFKERLWFILGEYGKLKKEDLANSVLRIQKRLGPLETKTCIAFLEENNLREAFAILLKYYDKTYTKSFYTRENAEQLLNKISAPSVDKILNTPKLLVCLTVNI